MTVVAETILTQLGGANKLSAMFGAKNFSFGEEDVTFSFQGCSKANMMKISLNGKDLYDVEFIKHNQRTCQCPIVKSYSDVPVENLRNVYRTVSESLKMKILSKKKTSMDDVSDYIYFPFSIL
ncbi:hypothetical protein P8807_09970 [Bacillus subtilis]|uniref:hypothetical protein n=1 Tax=Bacillus subtilis group TaxID=653685 RepID=UPI000CE03E2D|nr:MULTISPECIES: hypothetical protein [Bacillus subtilis group]AVB12074.1 hypothetical protein C3438_21675 [Bacillus velezensis]AYK76611.1 hypothetical protein D9C12_22980 [Bacillus subtilis subsp. subtilis]AYL03241.1 hypothetical protein D9C08_23135 [Bacillus subtilis subsp. subtilis]MCT6515463.1 hypothetical protein [Bacillus subtilis]MEC0326951.1 hypothetical protein [Bacillus subtilis]